MADEEHAAILLVDDNESNRIAMEALLESLGHPIISVASGEEALARLESDKIALIVMDVMMPGQDGFQTLIRIRKRREWSDIPVVFMTAVYGDPAHEAHGYTLGAVDYVSKPFNQTVVTAKLRSLIDMHLRSEQMRREAEELAGERAMRSERERILGIVSHDLRSPLSTIRTGADFLMARQSLGEPEKKITRRIQRNADRMARLINDLLDFTRVQSGALRIRPARADLAEVVVDSVEDIRQVVARDISVAVETKRLASFDSDRVAQALSNLVLNAVQHSTSDARVAVGLREQGSNFELSVWNEGEIPPKDSQLLFEPFRRGDRSQGMGLGLFITQQIAQAHGGELTFSSTPGAGTTFRLMLPINDA